MVQPKLSWLGDVRGRAFHDTDVDHGGFGAGMAQQFLDSSGLIPVRKVDTAAMGAMQNFSSLSPALVLTAALADGRLRSCGGGCGSLLMIQSDRTYK